MIVNSVFLLLLYAVAGGLVLLLAGALGRQIPWGEIVLFMILPLALVNRGLAPGTTAVPVDHAMAIPPWNHLPHPRIHNPALNDAATQFAPWAKAVRVAWKDGEIPHRNRWNGGGMPLAANGSSAAFFPLTFLGFLLPLARSFVLAGLIKLLLALIGTWLWLREVGLSREAARFGAVLFSLSFALTSWLYHPASAVICLWPWALFAIEALADHRISNRAFLLLIGTLSLWPLAGHGESAAMGALFAASWLGGRALFGDLPRRGFVILLAGLAALLAIGLTAFSTLPQWLAIEASNRLAIARDPGHLAYVPWVPYTPGWLGGFVTSLFPLAYGDLIESPMIPGAAGSIVEMGFGFFGLIGWTFALSFLGPGSHRPLRGWVLLALLVYGLGASMGLPPFRWVNEALPGIGLAPPLRMLLFVSLAGSALAAFEMDRLRRDVKQSAGVAVKPILVATGLIVAAVLVFLHFRELHGPTGGLSAQRRELFWAVGFLAFAGIAAATLAVSRKEWRFELFALLVVLAAAGELLRQGTRLYRYDSMEYLYPETPLVRFLRSQSPRFRVAGIHVTLLPNSNVFAGVEDIRTHDPIERRDYVEFLDATCGYTPTDYFKVLRYFGSPTLDFLNVRYLVSEPSSEAPSEKWRPVYAGPDGTVFENRDVLPRVLAPGEVQVLPPNPSRGRRVVNATQVFGEPLRDFLRRGSFETEAIVLPTHGGFPDSPIYANGRLTVAGLTESSNRVSFDAIVSEKPVIAVTSYSSDGGWSAVAEGKKLIVGLANGPFLSVLLPVGEYRVQLCYLPPGFRVGAIVSSAAVVTLLATMVVMRRRQSHPLLRHAGAAPSRLEHQEPA